jgi:hypothetical protein
MLPLWVLLVLSDACVVLNNRATSEGMSAATATATATAASSTTVICLVAAGGMSGAGCVSVCAAGCFLIYADSATCVVLNAWGGAASIICLG